ncbi:nuclear receptor coactivator 5-like isoform X2 [Ahaetulla prasina]|uniref:nuclear receptor coactivator 5-like isoform X2 n=1 Tax=Ahaetulla prasina TaxID=499056 RepID=UPI0026495B1B|nr:nuclear receptor coactivator 5-like isoform X2 [Ahaetulla prasina]
MSSWPKVTTDQAQTSDPEKRQRPGWIPRLLDINPYKSIQKSSYSPPDGYPKDHEDGNSFEELFGQQYHPSTENEDNYERHQYPQKDDSHTKDAHRDKLYLQFYQQIEKEYNRQRPSDCVIVSISKDQAEYSTAIGHRLQDHGLVVEMIYLTSESGLTRALQEVKNDGSPFCVLVEPSNVTLSSCTVIMLHQTIKIHRNMPMEDALALIAKEFEEIFAEHEQQQRTEISHKAADLADGFLERELYESYHVPLGIRHLLFVLSEGKHLYMEELNSISDYLKTRRNKLEGFVSEANTLAAAGEDGEYPNARPSGSALPPTLSKPPPLLPTPGRSPALGQSAAPSPKPALLGKRPLGALLPTPVVPAGPKGKPPPLLTKIIQRPMHLAPPHLPAKRPLLGGRPGLLPTPTYRLPR